MFLLRVGCVSLSMKHAPILYRSCLSLNEVDHRSTWDMFGISLPICWETKRNDRLKSILQVDTSVPSLIYVFRMHLCTHKLDDQGSIWASEKNSLSTSWPAGLTVIHLHESYLYFLHVNQVSSWSDRVHNEVGDSCARSASHKLCVCKANKGRHAGRWRDSVLSPMLWSVLWIHFDRLSLRVRYRLHPSGCEGK